MESRGGSGKPGRDVRGGRGGAGAAGGQRGYGKGAGQGGRGGYRDGYVGGKGDGRYGSGGSSGKGGRRDGSGRPGSGNGYVSGKGGRRDGYGKGSERYGSGGGFGQPGGRANASSSSSRAERPQGAKSRDLAAGRKSPGKAAGDLIEGRRATEEALELGIPIKRALLQKDGGSQDPALATLEARLVAAGVEVERVARPVLDSLSSHGAHQGVMLRVEPYRYAELADVIAAAGEGDALVVVLDHVTDEGNFGAIVRTAEVVGAAGVVVAKARAARVGVGAYKTSAGAVMHLPIAQVSNLTTALGELKDAGFWVGGATEHARDDVWSAPVEGRLALVMGSEGAGISRLVRETCDFEFRLPQRGQVESLNVAQATTAIAYEWLRRSMTDVGGSGGTAEKSAAQAANEARWADEALSLENSSGSVLNPDEADTRGLIGAAEDAIYTADLDLSDDFPDTSDFDFPDLEAGLDG